MRIVLLALALSMAGTVAHADSAASGNEAFEREPVVKTPFDRGKKSLSVGGGSTSYLGERYFAIGAGFAYYVLDGLSLGVSTVFQFGDGPAISKVAPQIRYVVKPLVGKWPLIPYVGVFYNRWFIGGRLADVDAVGSRAGLLYVSGSILLGLGIAVEKTVSVCAMDCVVAYPDLTISLAF
jgi:hypothetical protein